MFSYSRIKTALENRVAYRPTLNKLDTPEIASPLTVSESGLFVNSINSEFITNDVMNDFIVFFEGMDIDEWDNGDSYTEGDLVRQTKDGQDQTFRATDSSTGSDPAIDADGSNWETGLSFILRQFREDAVNELMNDLTTRLNLTLVTKRLLNNSPLFNERDISKLRGKSDRFVGVEIIPSPRNNVQLQTSKIGIKATEAETVTLYLFHSSQDEAIETFEIEILTPNKFVWYDLERIIDFINEETNVGGRYYIGYFEELLSGEFFTWKMPTYWFGDYTTTGNCNNCGGSAYSRNSKLWNAAKSYFEARPVSFTSLNGTDLPNIDENFGNVNYLDNTPFNLRMSSYCDPTNPFIESIQVFDKAYQAKIALLILTEAKNSNRVNSIGDDAARKLSLFIDGAFSNGQLVTPGLSQRYENYLDEIVIDYDELDPICFGNNRALLLGMN